MNGVHQGHLVMCRFAMQELLNLFPSLKISKTENKTKIRGIGGCALGSQYYWCTDAGRWFVVFRPMQVLNFEYLCHCKFNKLIQKHMYFVKLDQQQGATFEMICNKKMIA